MSTALAASGHLAYESLCFVSLPFPLPVRPFWGVGVGRVDENFFLHWGPNPLSAAPQLHYILNSTLRKEQMDLNCVVVFLHGSIVSNVTQTLSPGV